MILFKLTSPEGNTFVGCSRNKNIKNNLTKFFTDAKNKNARGYKSLLSQEIRKHGIKNFQVEQIEVEDSKVAEIGNKMLDALKEVGQSLNTFKRVFIPRVQTEKTKKTLQAQRKSKSQWSGKTGAKHPCSLPIEGTNIETGEKRMFASQTEASVQLGIPQPEISQVVNKENRTCHGWRFVEVMKHNEMSKWQRELVNQFKRSL